jgi:hypothetical protein
MGLLINAGVYMIVVKEPCWYDSMAKQFSEESGTIVICNGTVLR